MGLATGQLGEAVRALTAAFFEDSIFCPPLLQAPDRIIRSPSNPKSRAFLQFV